MEQVARKRQKGKELSIIAEELEEQEEVIEKIIKEMQR